MPSFSGTTPGEHDRIPERSEKMSTAPFHHNTSLKLRSILAHHSSDVFCDSPNTPFVRIDYDMVILSDGLLHENDSYTLVIVNNGLIYTSQNPHEPHPAKLLWG